MTAPQDCQFVRITDQGALVVTVSGIERTLAIFGVEVTAPPPALYLEIIGQRLPRTGRPLRCTMRTAGPGTPLAVFHYFAWHDKSGDVWEDLAVTLLDQGVVRVAHGDFPERAEYLRHQKP